MRLIRGNLWQLRHVMNRKIWLILLFLIGAGFVTSELFINTETKAKDVLSRETMFYGTLENNTVRCGICFRRCVIPEGRRGFCRNRENREGILYNIVYGRPSAVHVDPVEKEPQLHFLPGSKILCLGTAGCNFRCQYCQNWHLSQRSFEEMNIVYDYSCQQVINIALKKKIPTISFTYNEPISFYEYAYDIAKLAKKKGLNIIWHSNGSINPEPLKELLKYTDAVTIDLKGFTDKFYSEVSFAKLEPVLNTLKIIRKANVHLEIVNLVIPGYNDNPQDLKRMCVWIKDNLGPDVPLSFSRFSPQYKMTSNIATPIKTLEQAYSIAKEAGLNYVTIGNVPGHIYNSTFCPVCKNRLIFRKHFMVLRNNIENERCKFCNARIPGKWQ